jgi:protein-tyrosine-phosphatase
MAEAFVRIHGSGKVEAESAGSRPASEVNPRAVAAMLEVGYDLSSHRTKPTHQISPGPFDVVVTMGCGDECPAVPARRHEDWPLPDPKNLAPPEFNRVRDEIEERVIDLLQRIHSMPS